MFEETITFFPLKDNHVLLLFKQNSNNKMLGFFYSSVLLGIFVEMNTAQTTDYNFNSLCLIIRDTHTVMHIAMYLFTFSSPKNIYT